MIPARMDSSRFPGKPMAQMLGKPMIGHVYERVIRNSYLSLTAVATCDREIADYVKSIGGRALMTSDRHERASDRCAEALEILENEEKIQIDIIVMVQGDEPMIHPDMITEAVRPMLSDKNVLITNLLGKIESKEEFEDRNCIKVVCDLNGDALYFSREPIPTRSRINSIPMGKQVCIIPFRRDFLFKFTLMEPTPLEIIESIDMMRVLEHGIKVRMVPTKHETHAVDTQNDLQKVEVLMQAPDFE
ncbi:uncharacterized protein METZ01_LOCUS283763 [marine metagenome]|uniref:3-deoxy-manno-octulosonate cytidylyltransferase n=1 Tax=marine metagenome TaxID=408172 RepID=A0A382L2S2_9ZZZZ